MSAVIRLQLATVLATLKVKGRAVLTVLNATDTTVDEDDRLEADVVQLREAAGRAQVLVDTWSDMIARLMPTEQQDEMDILQAFPPPRGEVREDDEPTALAQIEHAYELVDLVNVCLQQRRNGGRGSVSSQRTGNSFMTTQSLQQLEEQPELYALPPQSPVEEYGCSLCHTGPTHKPSRCPMFNNRNRRKARLLEQGRCLNCLYDGHMLNKCRAANKCRRCGGRHHFMLCTQRQPKKRVYYPNGHHDGPSKANWRQTQPRKCVYYPTGHHKGPSEANWRVPTPSQPEVTYSGMVINSSTNVKSEADTKSSTSSTNRHRRRRVWINSKLKTNRRNPADVKVTPQGEKAIVDNTTAATKSIYSSMVASRCLFGSVKWKRRPDQNWTLRNSKVRLGFDCLLAVLTCLWLINRMYAGSTALFKCSSMHFLLMLALLLLVGIACWCKQIVRNAQRKPLQSSMTSKDGTFAAATNQTSTSFSNAGKFLCVTQAGLPRLSRVELPRVLLKELPSLLLNK
uniref:Uncharacterized protein n=1 Tax=Meloidogyne enterolobii TaxID=390850 RepID=A0A6V7Y6Y8_MELEN|nr:unnamed protein product [Meloidogyne enterolobii]